MAESELQAAQRETASAQKDAGIRKAAVTAAQSQVEPAQAQVQSVQANRKQVDIRAADAGTASAAVAAARANLEAAELQLSYTTIVAPMDGVVTRKSVEVGQIVQPGQGLMTIIPLQDIWVTANFKETQLADVHPGQRAEIHVDMYGKSVCGHVDSIAGATGSAHEPAAAGKCHRKFRQGGAAHSGEDSGGSAGRVGPTARHERGCHDLHEVKM